MVAAFECVPEMSTSVWSVHGERQRSNIEHTHQQATPGAVATARARHQRAPHVDINALCTCRYQRPVCLQRDAPVSARTCIYISLTRRAAVQRTAGSAGHVRVYRVSWSLAPTPVASGQVAVPGPGTVG